MPANTPAPLQHELQKLRALLNAGTIEPARAALRQLAESSPDSAAVHSLLGVAHSAANENAAALVSIERALQLDKHNPLYQLQCALILQSLGRNVDAAARYRQAIRLNPKSPEAHYNFGLLLQQQGDVDGALACYRSALLHQPAMVEALNNLGNVLLAKGRPQEALKVLQQAVALRPGFAVPHNNIGNVLLKLNRREEALDAFKRALELNSDFVEAITNLAEQYQQLGKYDEALALYDRVLTLDANNELTRFARDALAHANPARPPDEFVRKVFRDLAPNFDQHLVEKLGYAIPRLLIKELQPWIAGRNSLSVLDLGCGTGLFGVEIKPYCQNLVGIDLSAEMLAQAQQRQIYQQLEETDLASFLGRAATACYDLAVATDVFVYVGDLATTFQGAARALKPGGRFAFSVESIANEEGAYLLRASSRYGHSRAYIEALAAQHGFGIAAPIETPIRMERDAPIAGYLFILDKP